MSGWSATVSARRRSRALVAGDDAPTTSLHDAIAALALPGDPARWAATAPPAVLVAAGLAAIVGGPVLLAWTSIGLAAAVLAARRTAPARRAAAIDVALPAVLERVADQLRTGGSLGQAVAAATPEGVGDLATAWRKLVADAGVVGIRAALAEWVSDRHRPPLPSERLTAAALILASETGGSAARAVDGVASTLRSRAAVAQELRALTSQARLSAGVIAAGPVLFGALVGLTDPSTAAFFRSPAGAVLLGCGLTLDLAGALWMRHLCRSVA